VRAALGAGPDDVVVGAVGRLVREKGYQELLAAWPKVKAAYPAARLVIIGPADPDKADSLPAKVIDAARADGVIFLGMRDDVVELYAAMELYVLASYREGFPRSAMEAAAMGLPVVATNIRGCREVVDDGVTGTLVPPRDPAALGHAISVLVGDREARSAMGAAGRQKAARDFDQQRVIDITLATYERLLSRPGART
jgi:glycosyltransferase involved in cell wall biosynthesis